MTHDKILTWSGNFEQIYVYKVICCTGLFSVRSGRNLVHDSTLREKCTNTEFFWSVFSCIRTKYGVILRISPYSNIMLENKDQKKTPYLDTFHAVLFE